MFVDEQEEKDLAEFLDSWKADESGVKEVFHHIRNLFLQKKEVVFQFVYRPGVSGSFRAFTKESDEHERTLVALTDIIDDDPENRWISICFYGEMINDPEEEGDLVPGGLMGQDGYCFDIMGHDESMVSYLDRRIEEAWSKALEQ
jgi:hypothetical protein